MRVYRVIDRIKVGYNTAIAIADRNIELKNGSIILDENNKTYKVISIGMINNLDRNVILIEGDFQAKYFRIKTN